MSDDRYQVRRKPGYLLRVVDRKLDQVDGYWNMADEEWMAVDAPARDDCEKSEETRVQRTVVYQCPECGERAYFHANIGGAILWCEEHGVLATQKPVRGDAQVLKQMTDEQYKQFVEEDFLDERDRGE